MKISSAVKLKSLIYRRNLVSSSAKLRRTLLSISQSIIIIIENAMNTQTHLHNLIIWNTWFSNLFWSSIEVINKHRIVEPSRYNKMKRYRYDCENYRIAPKFFRPCELSLYMLYYSVEIAVTLRNQSPDFLNYNSDN